MKKFLIPITIAALFFFAACGDSSKKVDDSDSTADADTASDTTDTASDDTDTTDTTSDDTDTASDLGDEAIQDEPGYDETDITTIEDTDGCIEINLSDFASFTSDTAALAEATDTESDPNTKELTVTINSTAETCIKLSGSYDGGVKFKNKKDVNVNLILDSVNITSTTYPGYLKLNTGNEAFSADYAGNTYTVQLNGESTITGAANS